MTKPTPHTLDVPGAVLTFDVRPGASSTEPVLLLIGPPMAKFIALVSHKGTIPADFAGRPAPDAALFGLPTADDGSRDDPLVGQNMVSCTHYQHDVDALRKASTRIVIAAGAESEGEMAHRAAVAVAERLGTAPVPFPSGHGGFLGGEYGETGAPEAFAATLREVLTAKA